MSVEKHFLGKYTLASTDTPQKPLFATPLTERGEDIVIPVMAAASAGRAETWLAYGTETGMILQMGNLLYLSQMDAVGIVISTSDINSASRFRWNEVDPAAPVATVTLEILVEGNDWQAVSYGFEPNLPGYLVYPIPGRTTENAANYKQFTRTTITPSLEIIQSHKSLTNADLCDVDFSGEVLDGVDLSGSNLTGTILDGTKMTNGKLSGAQLMQASMAETDFTGTSLARACFDGSNISLVIWGPGSVASGASFRDCTASGANIGSSVIADWSHADLSGSNLSMALLKNVDLSSAILLGCNFSNAVLESTNLESAIMGGVKDSVAAVFSNAYLSNVNMKKANCFGVSFSAATFFGALTNLSETATLEMADFSNAYLEGINLTGAILRGSSFDNACLINVNFSNADLGAANENSTPTSLAGCCLQGASFTQAKLNAVNFDGSVIAFENGAFNVRYCGPNTGPIPSATDFIPMNHQATLSLDETTLQPDTICPNGQNLRANQALGYSLQTMLTAPDPPANWKPIHDCFKNG